MKVKKKTLNYLLKDIGQVKGKVILLTIFNILFAALSIAFALCCKEVIDASSLKDKDKIILFACVFLGIILTQFGLRIAISYLYEVTKSKLLKEKRQKVLSQILKKEYEKISKFHSGELLNRIFTDVEIVSEGVSNLIPQFMNMATRLLIAIGVLFVLDYQLSLIFIASGVVLFVIACLYRKKIKKAHREVLEKEDKVRSYYQENVENSLIVKVFNSQDKVINKGEPIQNNYVKARIKRRILSIQANSGFNLIFNLFYLLALVWGALKIVESDFISGYGTLFALLQLINQIAGPISGLSGLLPQFYGVQASYERLIELEQIEEENESVDEVKNFDSIKVNKVKFGYKDNLVLKDATFLIDKNDFIALTGLSGGGKTTLFNLLLGVYSKYEGNIEIISNKEVFQPNKNTRSLFSYVPQGNSLFSGSIKENLTFSNNEISDEEIYSALDLACAKDFVMSLEEKLDTLIGEKGLGLSEGQAQRLSIARCLLHNKEILLLDEATSALDEETEAKVLENIASLNKTVIIVTHRKKALDHCNKQLILDDGHIIEKVIKNG